MRHLFIIIIALSWSLWSACTEQSSLVSEDALVGVKDLASSDYISLQILPEKSEIAAGRRVPFRVIGILPYGKQNDLTSQGVFSSSDPSIVSFPGNLGEGMALTLQPGTASISFKFGDLEVTAELTVTQKVLDQFKLSQDSLQLAIEKLAQSYEVRVVKLQAIAVYSDGSTEDVSSLATWSLSDEQVFSQNQTELGSFSTKSLGTSQISAEYLGKSASLNAEIVLGKTELRSFSLNLDPLILPYASPRKLIITGHYSDGTTALLNNSAELSINPSTLAQVSRSQAGELQLTSLALGSGELTVSLKGLSNSFALLGVDAESSLLRLESSRNFSIPKGDAAVVKAWLELSDGTLEDVSSQATWTVASTSILAPAATPSQGKYTAARIGSTLLTAKLGQLSASHLVTVSAARVTSIAITSPVSTSFGLYQSRDFIATASYSDATTQVVSNDVSWSVQTNGGGGHFDSTVRNRFVATGSGQVSLQASLDGVVATYALTIAGVVPVSINLQSSWSGLSLATGYQQLSAMVSYSDNTIVDQTDAVTWGFQVIGSGLNFAGYVSDSAGTKGRCTPVALGFFKVTATYMGLQAEKSIQVNN